MLRLRRFLPVVLVGSLSTFFLLLVFQRTTWGTLPRAVGFRGNGPTDEQIASGENILPDLRQSRGKKETSGLNRNYTTSYPVGKTKAPGSNYTRAMVVASLKEEDTRWIADQLEDMIDSGLLRPRIYVVDDVKAALRVQKNKGHEVMVYLTYIIDNYDSLPDISIFTHAHQYAWHNNDVLDEDMAQMVRYLSPERVTREGYMNLRCHWEPGCPDWLHPGATKLDMEKKEEVILADKWVEVYPMDPVPTVLAQPCCAQFAVSRERVLAIPKQRYVSLRDWILRTDLSDYLSGRVFEYTWQFVFTSSPVYCPTQASCYCDGYGLCFGGDKELTAWLDMSLELNDHVEELRTWYEEAEELEALRKKSKDRKIKEDAAVRVPEVGKDELLKKKIRELKAELRKSRSEAFERGKDPKQRALEAGRPWTKGDGF